MILLIVQDSLCSKEHIPDHKQNHHVEKNISMVSKRLTSRL
jgi:hypothetical protein